MNLKVYADGHQHFMSLKAPNSSSLDLIIKSDLLSIVRIVTMKLI